MPGGQTLENVSFFFHQDSGGFALLGSIVSLDTATTTNLPSVYTPTCNEACSRS